MNTATILRGDAVTMLRTLPAKSVHCCVTSPPYWGLRDYGVAGQLGAEPTPAEYVANMVAVFAEVWRVLRDDGVMFLNIGDSYNSAASNQQSGSVQRNGYRVAYDTVGRQDRIVASLKPKDLLGIPWRVAFALQDAGWWLRQDIIWHKPNPMPESVQDRCTKAHEYVFLLTKSARYYYDAQAIAEPSTYPDDDRKSRSAADQKRMPTAEIAGVRPGSATYPTRNRRSVWTIATEPTLYAHFATMPTALAETCILAGCPAQVCAECGAPWVRVVEKGERIQAHWKNTEQAKAKAAKGKHGATSVIETGSYQTYETIGFAPTCTCDAGTIPGTVLDPFAGSGTTLRVAVSLGRDGIGVELNPEYADLAERLLAQTQPALIAV